MGRNQRLVYLRMTGWGQTGSMAGDVGHDINFLAMSGALAHIGRADQPPTPPLNVVADFGGGGMLAVVGVLSALFERSTSGHGQIVDAAMVDGAATLMAPLFGAWSSGFWSAERGRNLLDSGAPFYDCYATADGGWMAVGAIEPQFFSNLLAVLELSEADVGEQHDHEGWPRMRERFAATFAQRSRQEWTELFAGVDACVTPVLDMGAAPHHPVARERASFVTLNGVSQPAPAPRFSRTPPQQPSPALDYQDPHVALAGWNIDRGRIDHLIDEGVVA
jgi:alpha-methylacyl-CoA racemase